MVLNSFNWVHWLMLICPVFLTVVIFLLFRNASEKARMVFLVSLCAFNVVVFFVYKWVLSADAEFVQAAGLKEFNWLNELPLQLCNINMFLIPISLLTKNRPFMGFSFVLAPLGAYMALLFPEPAFRGFSLWNPRMVGFYLTHILIVVAGLSLATLNFFRPRKKDILGIFLAFSTLGVGAHLFNTVMRLTGLSVDCNYFYTYGSDISILNLFWKWIPVPLLYLLPALLILFAYLGILFLVFYLLDLIRKKG